MRGAWLIAFVLATPACLRDPSPSNGDAGSDSADGADAGDGGDASEDGWTNGQDPGPELQVMGPAGADFVVASDADGGFQIEFPSHGFPRRIGWGSLSESVLADPTNCDEESGIGIALYPNQKITNPSVDINGAGVTQPLVSRLVVQVEVPIDVDYGPGCEGGITGSSVFTIFPDGRIHRHDQISASEVPDDQACRTCGGGPYFFTSFVTANIGASGDIDVGASTNGTSTAERYACARNAGRSLAVGWRTNGTATQRYRDLGATFASVHDLATGAALSASTYDRDSDLLLGASAAECSTLKERLEAITPDTTELRIDGIETGMRQNDDGIYDMGGAMDSVLPSLDVSTVTLRPSPSIPGSFAVRLNFGGQVTENLRIRHSSGASVTPGWARADRLPDGTVVFFFRDPLPVGQSITIQL